MSVQISEVSYGIFGRCLRMAAGGKELLVTVDMGPYIIRYGYEGEDNMFFEDVDKFATNDVTDSPYKHDLWWVVGGHRLWCSPEKSPRTYYPDYYPVDVKQDGSTVVFTAPMQEWSQIQCATQLTMDERGNVELLHTITNKNAWSIELAPWTVTVMNAGGVAYIPQNKRKTGFFPNKWVCFWDYTPMNDSRISLGDDYITVSMDPDKEVAAKVGVLNEHGWMAYLNKGNAFIKKFGFQEGAAYPDNGCNCESYTCRKYTEMECLSPMVKIEPGKTAQHKEVWELKKAGSIELIANKPS